MPALHTLGNALERPWRFSIGFVEHSVRYRAPFAQRASKEGSETDSSRQDLVHNLVHS
jgi:hypothetical protein